MLSAGKNWSSYKPSVKLDKKVVAYAPVGEKLLTAYQLWTLMSVHFLTSFLGDW
jgi:hypothetical protein